MIRPRFGILLLFLELAPGCGGRATQEREGATGENGSGGAFDNFAACEAEGCQGLACDTATDCPEGTFHYKACLPAVCGAASECQYTAITAGIGSSTLVCSCDGTLERVPVGTGSPPTLYAYAFTSVVNSYLCSCGGGDEICELSTCLGNSCDPLSSSPETRYIVTASDLPSSDGAGLVVLSGLDRSLSVAVGLVREGSAEFELSSFDGRPTFLLDENGDGECNEGEWVLRYYKEFLPLEQSLRIVVLPDNPIPCEERLPLF